MSDLRPRHSWIVVTWLVAGVTLGAAWSPAAGETAWQGDIRAVDDALARSDTATALRAWHDAYVAALSNWGWEGMLEVGDAALRMGGVAGARRTAEARARQTYLTAFFRAWAQESRAGVLRTAEAFARLGDRETVEQCLAAAERLAATAPDPQAHERMLSFVAGGATPAWTAEILGAP